MSAPHMLTLFGRERCHLCEEMFEDLQPLLRGHDVRLEEVDVDSTPALRDRYGLRVPVLVCADGEVLAEGRLDPAIVQRWLDGLASDPAVHP